jgi:DMSO/TMAO reductase YedYZ molybdopterin-dependent catalytic subunit
MRVSRPAADDGGASPGSGVLGQGKLTRRAALALGGVTAGAFAASAARDALGAHEPFRATPDRPPPAAEQITYEEAELAFRCHGFHLERLDSPITPLGSHFVLIHFDIPRLDASGYTITVGGRVRTPLTLSLESLKTRQVVKEAAILECAGTGRSFQHPRAVYVPWFHEPIGVYEYTGTPLRPILEEAGLLDDAVDVVFTGHDEGIDLGVRHHFERGMPLDEAMKDGVILAWEANGQPLLQEHGFPLRLIVPTWYGMQSVKYLKQITVIDHTYQGVENKQVYRLTPSLSDGGRPVQRKAVKSLIRPPGFPDLLTRRRFVERGKQTLEGKAWSGNGPITKVEVSTDDRRTFQPATLGDQISLAWTPWTFEWTPPGPGDFVLSVRATDAEGNTQPLQARWNVQGMAQNMVQRLGVTVL